MQRKVLFILLNLISYSVFSQSVNRDSVIRGTVTVSADPRIEALGKKMAEYNESLSNKIHLAKGYRLMLMSTTDRAQALALRAALMQQFPDQSVYMTFQSPYIRLKFGNFLDKEEAEKARKQIIDAKLVSGNVYILPEMIEVKPDKTKQTSSEE